MKISRRSFVKGTATGIGAVVVGKDLAVAQAPVDPKKYPFETPPASIPAAQIKQTFSSDIVIVGAGVSGLVCGLAAAEAGASVIEIEKMSTFSARGGDNTAVNSRLHEKLGIHLDTSKIIHELMLVQGSRLNQGVVQLWAQNSGKVMNWIMDIMEPEGLQTQLVVSTRSINDEPGIVIDKWPNPTGTPEGWDWQSEYTVEYPTVHRIGGLDWGQRRWVGIIEKKSLAKGTQIYYQTKGVRLLREPKGGRVHAVIAQNKDGAYIRYNAKKAVIISTGDYSQNGDMIAKYVPSFGHLRGRIPTSMGEGHQMGMWIGAVMEKTPHGIFNDAIHAMGTDAFLMVNMKGKRFCNEDLNTEGIARQCEEQNGAWLVLDSTWPDDVPRMGCGFDRIFKATPLVRKEFQDKVNSGKVLQADTLDELAAKMKVPAPALKQTIQRYNELYKLGKDLDFGKRAERLSAVDTPPYYAQYLPPDPGLMCIFGGLVVNDHLQALDANDDVIPGLYLTGNVVGGRFKVAYPLICPGISHSMAWTTGYMAGKFASGKA